MRKTTGGDRWMAGFFGARDKGYAAGEDPDIKEKDNPYTRFEHRHMWLEGFRAARAAMKSKGEDNK